MPSTLELCEKYFGTRDIYKLLEINKDSLEKEIKKAYYKLSLKVHPDRVPEEEKEIATEKFKVLARIHQVLGDKDKKALYDEQGTIDEDEDESTISSWLDLWRKIFKPISIEDINNYQKEYMGSEIERTDIKKAYLNGKGCINFMMNSVPFMGVEDEPRIQKIVLEMISSGEVPEYKLFTNEPKNKRNRRHKKYAKESEEAAEIKANLEDTIVKRQQERSSNYESFLDKLLNKYGGDEENDAILIKSIGKKKKTKAPGRKSIGESKPKERKVQNGRVHKP